jgi:hypothetical protein
MQLHLLGCSATSAGLSPTFRDSVSVPSSNVKMSRHLSRKVGSKSTCVAQQPRTEKISNSAHFPNNKRLVFVLRNASVYCAVGTERLNITQIDFTFISHSMAQETDNRRPLTAEVRVRCRPRQCEVCGGKSGLEQVLLPALPLSHVSVIRRTHGRSLGTYQTLDIGEHWPEEYCTVAVLSCGLLRHDAVRSAATTVPPP